MSSISRDARAMFNIAIFFLIIAVIGFWPNYFGPLFAGMLTPVSDWMHPHVITSLLWLILFLAQPALIGARSYLWHRRLGYSAILLFLANTVTGFMLQVDLLPVESDNFAAIGAFTARFISGLGVYIPAFFFALVYRRETDIHLRLMYLATMSLMPSPFGRIVIEYIGLTGDTAGPLTGLITLLLALLLPLYDRITCGRVLRVSWIAAGAVLGSQIVFGIAINSAYWLELLTGS